MCVDTLSFCGVSDWTLGLLYTLMYSTNYDTLPAFHFLCLWTVLLRYNSCYTSLPFKYAIQQILVHSRVLQSPQVSLKTFSSLKKHSICPLILSPNFLQVSRVKTRSKEDESRSWDDSQKEPAYSSMGAYRKRVNKESFGGNSSLLYL